MTRKLYVFVGRSGTGKSSVVEGLKKYGYKSAKSTTDRPKRYPNEDTYKFVSTEEIMKMRLFVPTKFAGHHYGVQKEMLDIADIVILDLRGALEIKEAYQGIRDVRIVGIHTPYGVLRERMRSRGDDENTIKVRLEHDEVAFGYMDDVCDIVLNNLDLEETVSIAKLYIGFCEGQL